MFHSIAIDPTNANVVYAGTETSGIFKTTDGGATWTRLRLGFKCGTQQTGYPQIFDIAIDPMNPQTLYSATINGPGPLDNPVHPAATAGIYKSTDEGLTWTQKNQGLGSAYVNYVMVDSTNSSRLYAGVGGAKSTFPLSPPTFYEGGIYISNDAGETWSPLPAPSGLKQNILVDMVVRGASQQNIYASGMIHGTDAAVAHGFARSTDGGQTWTTSNPWNGKIMGFDVYQQDPTIVYGHDDSTGRKVHKSTDGGLTWTQLQSSFYGVVRIHPQNSQTVWYTGQASINKSTNGFATSREVYRDPTLTSAQQMVDIKVSTANPNVVWAAAKGYYLYRSTDGGDTFTKITAIRDLVYGSALTYHTPVVAASPSMQTGIAVINSTTSSTTVTLTAYTNTGALLAGPGVQNPLTIPIAGKSQFIGVVSQLIGANTQDEFWARITTDRSGTTGFFLSFDPALNTMDGANFTHRLLRDFVLPDIREVDAVLVNPHSTTEQLTLTWYNNDGVLQETRSLPLEPNARFSGLAAWLFPWYIPGSDGYMRVTSARGIVAAERTLTAASSTFVSGLHADTGSRLLYSPQFVFGGGFKTSLTLVSLENVSSSVTLTWTDKNGSRVGQPVTVTIPGRGRAVVSDVTIFGVPQPETLMEGHLGIRSNAARFTGTVTFGDDAGTRFRTSLPLLTEPAKDVIYSHVAQDATWYTGIAIVNMNNVPANVTISIFNKDGVQIGTGNRTIAASARISEVLTQIDSRLPPQSNGYFRVISDQSVFSFALFGTHALTNLAAIPGQILP